MNRAELLARNPKLYQALYAEDPKWMEQHLPKKYSNRRKIINWIQEDDSMLARLKAEHAKLTGYRGFPKRICRDSILGALGGEKWSGFRSKRMPKSSRFLKNIMESPTQYVIRRLRYVAGKMHAGTGPVHVPELLRRAKVYPEATANPKLLRVINKLCSRPSA